MVRIETIVFIDIETTGLPFKERNRTKITELCLIAVTRNDMRRCKGTVPPISKLTLMFNPQKTIQQKAADLTGLTNNMLMYSSTFKEKFNTIHSFLEDLKKPICLVAHNGNAFDYKILLAECIDANVNLPEDLYCADSLVGFKKLLKDVTIIENDQSDFDDSILTDDEDDWPDLHNKAKEIVVDHKKQADSYKLIDIYKKLFNKEPENSHRAEDDCLMLLKCVGLCQNRITEEDDFLRWIEDNCKMLNEITPLKRQ